MKKNLIIAVLAGLSLSVVADHKVDQSQLPQAVQKTVNASKGDGTIKEIQKQTKDGKTVYEVQFDRRGLNPKLWIAEDGSVVRDSRKDEPARTSEPQPSRSTDALTAEQKDVDPAPATDADNTRRNRRDRDNATLTPGDQGNTKEDIEVTRQIRRALMKDKTLSTTAKNVKIITKDGAVTLRGPVKTTAEKHGIVAKAKEVATDAHPITDEIEVKAQTEFERTRSSEGEVKDKP